MSSMARARWPTLDPQVLVEQGSVPAFEDAVALRPATRCLVLNALQLEEQLVGVLVGAAAELAAVAHCEQAR